MKKRLISLIIVSIFLLSSSSFANLISWDELDENFDWEECGCRASDIRMVGEEYKEVEGEEDELELYTMYWFCNCKDECRRTKQPKRSYTFNNPTAKLEVTSRNNNVVDDTKTYYEQGVVLKKGSDYELQGKTNDRTTITKNVSYYVRDDGTYRNKYIYTSKLENILKIRKNEISSDEEVISTGDISQINLPNDIGNYKLIYEAHDIIELEEGYKYPDEEWEYDDPYEVATRVAKAEVDLCVGPYPIVYYNAILADNNQDSHIDTIKVENIKMTCTYFPKDGVTFKLYNKNGYIMDVGIAELVDSNPENSERSDGLGYNVELQSFSKSLGYNIDPMEDYYLMVIPNDGRTGTPEPKKDGTTGLYLAITPNAPKYAKFDNPGF